MDFSGAFFSCFIFQGNWEGSKGDTHAFVEEFQGVFRAFFPIPFAGIPFQIGLQKSTKNQGALKVTELR